MIPAGAGRLVTPDGTIEAPAGAPCGAGRKVDVAGDVIAFLPPGPAERFPEVPATMATQVERFAWRIGDVLGPRAGLRPGGRADVDPATWEGVTVRSVKKTRRSGPPLLIGVGDRDGTAVVAVTDRDADRTLAAATFADAGTVLLTTPAFDADGDGLLDVFVYGTGDKGAARARVVVDPREPVRVGQSAAVVQAPVVCGS